MATEMSGILIEVEGALEDVLAEVFRKRVCPMLEYFPYVAVRLVVSTLPVRCRDGAPDVENTFSTGAHGPEFTWQTAGTLIEAVHRFRFEFLGNIDARALECHVLFGIYRETAQPAATPGPLESFASPDPVVRPSDELPAARMDELSIVSLVEVSPAAIAPLPLHVVAEGTPQRLATVGVELIPEPDAVDNFPLERIAQVIDAVGAMALSPDELTPGEEGIPEEILAPLPTAEISNLAKAETPGVPAAEVWEESAESGPGPEPPAAGPELEPDGFAPLVEAWEQGFQETPSEANENVPGKEEPLAPAAQLSWSPDLLSPEVFSGNPAQELEDPLDPLAELTSGYCEPLTLVDATAAAPLTGRSPEALPGNFYQDFFGFEFMPFNNTPDTQFYFPSARHEEALARLLYVISERKGFVLITGEIGCGKSTLCRELIGRLPWEIKTAMVTQTHLSAVQLLRAIAEDFGLETRGCTRYEILLRLNEYLIQQMAEGSTACIIIDEAQNLEPEVLEEVRMISNLETEQDKLVQIILLGQPELRNKLARPELKQLRQRIAVQYHLGRLSGPETVMYIHHRLKVAKPSQPLTFKRGAMLEAHRFSGGVPRLINTLCDNAMLTAYTRGRRIVGGGLIREAARDLGIDPEYGRLFRLFRAR